MTGPAEDVTGGAIRGEGLALRPLGAHDRRRMLELAHDPEQLAYGIPVGVPLPSSEADLDERVARSQAAHERVEPGDLAIVEVAEPEVFLGSIGWRFDTPAVLRIADVGYAVHPEARGRGIATRALRLLVRWLLLDASGPGLPRVQLDHSVENPASCRVALAAGLPREGVRRGFLPLRGPVDGEGTRRHDVCLHGALLSDLPDDLPADLPADLTSR